jgi:hypothetical protein
MTWIRGPLWDGFWILSGLPIGLTLMILPVSWFYAVLLGGIVLNHAHLVSPVVVAWSNRGFRRVMMGRWQKFIILPVSIMIFGILFSLKFQRHDWPFEILVGTYILWNAFHFGMQNFGVMVLYGHRLLGFVYLCVTILAMAVLPLTHGSYWMALILTGVFSFNHWMTDIGLSGLVSGRRWLFIGTVLVVGFLGFLFKTIDCNTMSCQSFMYSVPIILGARICLGFVHFLYWRWVWKLSDPQVRATIGRELFRKAHGIPA